ncbi:hypothetical protein BU15DRAFT_56441 [Melanogaster broomeanus]|nr:hypothetical protein BU15DRAFT_56441 [Melanogaster broomeanus]
MQRCVPLFAVSFKTYTDSCHHDRFATCCLCFMDVYHKGLNSKQATLAARKYHGHRTLPLSVFDDLENAKMTIV